MTMLIKRSRKVPSESTTSSTEDLFVDSSLSAQNQLGVPSPSPSSEEQFIESSSSSAEDQFTESSPSPSGEEQFIESSSSAEDKLTDPSSSAQVSVSMNQEGPFEEKNSQSIMTGETENKEPNFDTAPMDSTMSDQSGEVNGNMENTYSSNSSKTQVCNYSKGRWVPSAGPRFYSGFDCKRWLPGSWACRLTKREDFSYEGYRWQPMDCEMPEFERMQDKTIAFIGDSLGKQQFHSLMCMATGGQESPEVQNVGSEYGFDIHPGGLRPDGWAYRFPTTNTTILFHWSLTLCSWERIKNKDPNPSYALHLDRVPGFLSKFLHRFDVLVLNTAQHWIKAKFIANHWNLYVNGKPIKDGLLMDMNNVKNFTVHRVVQWLDSQLPLHPGLKVFFRTKSPRHLDQSRNCNDTAPFLTVGSEVIQQESSDKIVENAVKGTRINILDITALSDMRHEAHKSQYHVFGTSAYYDCLHWCLPGIPDTWNELLAAQL
ncbi:hypothetical protein COLO4_35784 [Corchorus olitorius]|uniref:Uncharacterized protein n=1 Tax=Corchorus olitorius TaxID=93759 RepID=A0A1R3GDA5_9ROSI|nr:hypothetical protein COLO4_35784 [Corchorus olitorius]